ncbi:jg21966 [Pararge aegeria aegeria]|uniref:Jg21966 protein n=1 Tax=Pararge aegeria aegeria TaxID=348720 RepID=A0A8S4SFN4_9NEOP|nr:jg21966 [Pararge aegeria aegeria]
MALVDAQDGEASESDTEVEVGKSPNMSPSSKAFVISGEAPESDDESKLPSPASVELDSPLHTSMSSSPSSPTKLIHNSLLHQKLWECNISLRATIDGLAKHTTDICVEKLTHADKTLLSVQGEKETAAVQTSGVHFIHAQEHCIP